MLQVLFYLKYTNVKSFSRYIVPFNYKTKWRQTQLPGSVGWWGLVTLSTPLYFYYKPSIPQRHINSDNVGTSTTKSEYLLFQNTKELEQITDITSFSDLIKTNTFCQCLTLHTKLQIIQSLHFP